jgi:DNA-binding MarR family transcriptional regulator
VAREQEKKKAASASSAITQPQMKMLGATARRKGLTVAEDVRQFCADVIGRDITSARDLTKSEASQVIDKLTALPDQIAKA